MPKYVNLLAQSYNMAFVDLIDLCGEISYDLSMIICFEEDGYKGQAVARAYGHDLSYYRQRLKGDRIAALNALSRLKVEAKNAKVSLALYDTEDDSTKDHGHELMEALKNTERRRAYRGYLETASRNDRIISPFQLETKFQLRLKRRVKRKSDKNK